MDPLVSCSWAVFSLFLYVAHSYPPCQSSTELPLTSHFHPLPFSPCCLPCRLRRSFSFSYSLPAELATPCSSAASSLPSAHARHPLHASTPPHFASLRCHPACLPSA